MRMKKIIMIAAVAIAAAACSKTFDTNLATEKAIGFGTWAENLTKAYSGTWADDETFVVYGKKTTGSNAAITVFDGVDVTYKTATTKWSYTDIKFWDVAADNYTFYAFLPKAQFESGNTNGVFTSKQVSFANPQANTEDILVASEYSRDKVGTAMPTGEVQLAFNHAASLIDIYIKKDKSLGDDAVLTVTAASLKDILYKGTLKVNTYTASKPDFTWDREADVKNYAASNLPVITSQTTYDANGDAASTTPVANELFASYILMPQTLGDDQQLEISYKIELGGGEATYTKSVKMKDFVKSDNTTNNDTKIAGWNDGVHYIYYVTIGANAITFTATVNPWDVTTSTGYHYILN